ncbi:MAG: hypothetical protein WAN72_26390 [Candidatus Acidiferrales bacterium]
MKCEPLLLVVTRDDYAIIRDSAGVSERHARHQVMNAEKGQVQQVRSTIFLPLRDTSGGQLNVNITNFAPVLK